MLQTNFQVTQKTVNFEWSLEQRNTMKQIMVKLQRVTALER